MTAFENTEFQLTCDRCEEVYEEYLMTYEDDELLCHHCHDKQMKTWEQEKKHEEWEYRQSRL